MGLLETHPSHPYQTLAALFFGCIVLVLSQLKKSWSGNPQGLSLPLGPKGYPLVAWLDADRQALARLRRMAQDLR